MVNISFGKYTAHNLDILFDIIEKQCEHEIYLFQTYFVILVRYF